MPRALLAQPTTAPLPANLVEHELQQLVAQLNDPAVVQAQKDELARRLVQRPGAPATQAMLNILNDSSNRTGQLAVARALAIDVSTDAAFIEPLFRLLNERTLTSAAAEALAAYKEQPQVLDRLIVFLNNTREREVRVAAVRAIGAFFEKRAAETLIRLLSRDDEPLATRLAAADALADLTGLTDNGRDIEAWQRWWQANAQKSENQWQLDLVSTRAGRFDRLQHDDKELATQTQALLEQVYQSTPAADKGELLLRYMRSTAPAIRVLGPRLISQAISEAVRPPAAARDQLRLMVSDSSPMVRLAVAEALFRVNDPEALQPILVQLELEQNTEVRRALAAALEPIRDVRAVPTLTRLLNEPSLDIAMTAARALAYIGPTLLRENPALAESTSQTLREVYDRQARRPERAAFAEALINAMSPLRSEAQFEFLLDRLHPREPTPVHRAALRALGELRNPKAADRIALSLDSDDPQVRLDAVNALGSTAAFAQASSVLVPKLEREPDQSVRDAAWLVLESLLPTAPAEELQRLEQQFRDQPPRRLRVLIALADALLRKPDEEALAVTQQHIGTLYLELNQPDQAVPYLRKALDYWRTQGVGAMVWEGLVGDLMEALLLSKQYEDAAEFAEKMIANDKKQEQTMGNRIRLQVEKLRNEGDITNAKALINATKKMDPPVAKFYLDALDRIEVDISKRVDNTLTASGS